MGQLFVAAAIAVGAGITTAGAASARIAAIATGRGIATRRRIATGFGRSTCAGRCRCIAIGRWSGCFVARCCRCGSRRWSRLLRRCVVVIVIAVLVRRGRCRVRLGRLRVSHGGGQSADHDDHDRHFRATHVQNSNPLKDAGGEAHCPSRLERWWAKTGRRGMEGEPPSFSAPLPRLAIGLRC